MITACSELVSLMHEWGFVPMYRSIAPGFSVDEQMPPEIWNTGDLGDPREWKGPTVSESGGACGKFFRSKAGFISRERDFANYRRDCCDFDARYEDGMVSFHDKKSICLPRQYLPQSHGGICDEGSGTQGRGGRPV